MVKIQFKVVQGYQVASGQSETSPFPKGTIAIQKPCFYALGLDLTEYYLATLNAKFDCKEIRLVKWDYEFCHVEWLSGFPAETFRFAQCKVVREGTSYDAFIYQPIEETKTAHFQPQNTLEIICKKINDLKYHQILTLEIESDYLNLT